MTVFKDKTMRENYPYSFTNIFRYPIYSYVLSIFVVGIIIISKLKVITFLYQVITIFSRTTTHRDDSSSR